MDIIEKVKFWVSCLSPKKFKEAMAKEKGKGDLIEASKNIFVSALIMMIPIGLAMVVWSLAMGANAPSYFGLPFVVLVVAYLVVALIAAPISFLIMQGFYWVLARILGGKGEYRQQAYFASLFTAGVYIATIACIVPCLGSIISLALMILFFYLQYLVVIEVHKLGKGRAVLVVLAPILGFILAYIALLLYLTPMLVSGGAVQVSVPAAQ